MNFSQALGYLKAGRRMRQDPNKFWISLTRSEPPDFIWEASASRNERWFPTAEALLADTWEVEALAAPEGLLIQSQEAFSAPGDLIFCVTEGIEVLRFRGNGDVFVRGNLIDNDVRILKALKEFLISTPYGSPFKAELIADGIIVEPRTRFERVLDDAD